MKLSRSVANWLRQAPERLAWMPLGDEPANPRDKVMEALEQRVLFSINPSGAEQEMLEMINRMRANPTDELEHIFISTDQNDSNYFVSHDSGVNAAVNFFGVDDTTLFAQFAQLSSAPPLAWNEALLDSALDHSNLMIAHDQQAHVLPGEAGLLDRMVNAGYNWSGSVSVSENVFAYTENVFHGHAAFVIDWGVSPTGIQNPAGHRDNIMDADLQEIGIAVVAENNSSTSVGPLVVTQDFGVRGNYGNGQVLGVVFEDGDGDAFYDAGEGLGGVTITISNGSNVYTTTTMDAGGYQVHVAPGTYSVVASGGAIGAATYMGSVTVTNDNVKLDLDKTNTPVSSTITGTVFGDSDEDEVQDGGESGLSGFTVFIDTDADGNLDAGETSTTTDANGSYTFTGLGTGTFDVAIANRGGYLATSATTQSVSISVVGELADGNDFGQFQWLTKSGNVATVTGTSGADSITFTVGANGTATVGFNGFGQTLESAYTSIQVDGNGGNDSIAVTMDSGDDSATLRPGTIYVNGASHTINGVDFEEIRIYGGGGTDYAFLHDDSTSDQFVGKSDYAYLTGANFYNFANDFDTVKAFSTAGGDDVAFLYDDQSDDTFVGRHNYAYLSGNGFYNWAEGFAQVKGYATGGGNDLAFLYDDQSNDTLTARPEYAYLWGAGFYNFASGFDTVKAYASVGNDNAFLYDSAANDVYSARPEFGYLRGPNQEYFNFAYDFDSVKGFAVNGGYDQAYFYDSSGNDVYTAHSNYALLRADDSSFFNYVSGFDKTNAFGGAGGTDSAFLYDSQGNDVFTATDSYALLRDETTSFFNYVRDFANVYGYSNNGGNDAAFLYDSSGNDTLKARIGYASISGSSFLNRANNFATVNAYGNNGGTNSEDIAATIDFVLQQFGDWD